MYPLRHIWKSFFRNDEVGVMCQSVQESHEDHLEILEAEIFDIM